MKYLTKKTTLKKTKQKTTRNPTTHAQRKEIYISISIKGRKNSFSSTGRRVFINKNYFNEEVVYNLLLPSLLRSRIVEY